MNPFRMSTTLGALVLLGSLSWCRPLIAIDPDPGDPDPDTTLRVLGTLVADSTSLTYGHGTAFRMRFSKSVRGTLTLTGEGSGATWTKSVLGASIMVLGWTTDSVDRGSVAFAPSERVLVEVGVQGAVLDGASTRFVIHPAPNPWPDTAFGASGNPILAMGPEQTLATSNLLGSGLDYFPDEGTSLLPSPAGTIRLLVGTGSSWLLTGNGTLGDVQWTTVSKVLEPSPTSGIDNGYAGFSGAWTDANGRIWGVYHAEDHVGLPNIAGTQIPGFYATVALAISDDGGLSWAKRASLIRSDDEKDVSQGAKTDQGAAEPGVVASPDGKWL